MGSLTSIQKVLNSPSSPGYLFNIAVASPLGNNSLGQASLGGGLIVVNGEELLPKFKIINTMPLNNCFEWQPIYYSDILDSRWEILAVATNADVKSGQDATFIVK